MLQITNEEWFEGLKAENPMIEKKFYHLVLPMIRKVCAKYKLDEDEESEVLIYAIITTINHIQTERYLFQGFAPTTYTVNIAKWKALNEVRKRTGVIIDDFSTQPDFAEDFYKDLEKSLWYNEQFLSAYNQLDPNCQIIIDLYYNEGKTDGEIATNKDIPQNNRVTVNRKKGNCIEHLKELLQKVGFFL